MEKRSTWTVYIFILLQWIFFEGLREVSWPQTMSENDRHPNYLPDTSAFYPLFVHREDIPVWPVSSTPVIPTSQAQPSSRPKFPLQLSSWLFVFHMLGGSFLRLGFSVIYIIFSIGSSVNFPKTRLVFWPVVSGGGALHCGRRNAIKTIATIF